MELVARRCTKCGETKVVGEFYECRRSQCKTCVSQAGKEYHQEHREENNARSNAYREVHPEEVRVYMRAYREAHSEEAKARVKAWRAVHPEAEKARKKAYREAHFEEVKAHVKSYRAAHPEKVRVYNRVYREAHPEKVRARNTAYRETHLEKVKARAKAYRQSHRACKSAWQAGRRIAQQHRTLSASPKEIEAFYTEAERITKETGVKYSVDHVVPLQGKLVSGLHVPWNLRVIPLIDNIKKGNYFHDSEGDAPIAL